MYLFKWFGGFIIHLVRSVYYGVKIILKHLWDFLKALIEFLQELVLFIVAVVVMIVRALIIAPFIIYPIKERKKRKAYLKTQKELDRLDKEYKQELKELEGL